MDQRIRWRCIKGKQCHCKTVTNNDIYLCSKQSNKIIFLLSIKAKGLKWLLIIDQINPNGYNGYKF